MAQKPAYPRASRRSTDPCFPPSPGANGSSCSKSMFKKKLIEVWAHPNSLSLWCNLNVYITYVILLIKITRFSLNKFQQHQKTHIPLLNPCYSAWAVRKAFTNVQAGPNKAKDTTAEAWSQVWDLQEGRKDSGCLDTFPIGSMAHLHVLYIYISTKVITPSYSFFCGPFVGVQTRIYFIPPPSDRFQTDGKPFSNPTPSVGGWYWIF